MEKLLISSEQYEWEDEEDEPQGLDWHKIKQMNQLIRELRENL